MADFKDTVRDRSLITGEGSLVEKGKGQIFLWMKKKGGGKNFCAI